MKKSFMCSLICPSGILGGGLYIEDNAITYKTTKLTVDRRYKNLVLQLNQISELTWKWIIFPVAIFKMKNGENYKFIIFNKKRFNKHFDEVKGL